MSVSRMAGRAMAAWSVAGQAAATAKQMRGRLAEARSARSASASTQTVSAAWRPRPPARNRERANPSTNRPCTIDAARHQVAFVPAREIAAGVVLKKRKTVPDGRREQRQHGGERRDGAGGKLHGGQFPRLRKILLFADIGSRAGGLSCAGVSRGRGRLPALCWGHRCGSPRFPAQPPLTYATRAAGARERISRRSIPADLIRGGHRFAETDMRKRSILERIPIPQERIRDRVLTGGRFDAIDRAGLIVAAARSRAGSGAGRVRPAGRRLHELSGTQRRSGAMCAALRARGALPLVELRVSRPRTARRSAGSRPACRRASRSPAACPACVAPA